MMFCINSNPQPLDFLLDLKVQCSTRLSYRPIPQERNALAGTFVVHTYIGVRTRVETVTGSHDRPLHYQGSDVWLLRVNDRGQFVQQTNNIVELHKSGIGIQKKRHLLINV